MGWKLGLLGGIIGGFLGGGWGAILGGSLGLLANTQRRSSSDRRDEFVICFFQCLGKLAKADGRVCEDEAAYVSSLLEQLQIQEPALRQRLKDAFREGRDSAESFHEMLLRIRSFLVCNARDYDMRVSVIRGFCCLVQVDGRVSDEERRMLADAEQMLGVSGIAADFFQENRRSRSGGRQRAAAPENDEPTLEDCYKALGITADATNSEVKKAWRKKALEYHPDHVQGAGLSEAFVEFAKTEMQRINAAYDTICKARNM